MLGGAGRCWEHLVPQSPQFKPPAEISKEAGGIKSKYILFCSFFADGAVAIRWLGPFGGGTPQIRWRWRELSSWRRVESDWFVGLRRQITSASTPSQCSSINSLRRNLGVGGVWSEHGQENLNWAYGEKVEGVLLMSYIPILLRGKRVWEQEGWLIHYCGWVHQSSYRCARATWNLPPWIDLCYYYSLLFSFGHTSG